MVAILLLHRPSGMITLEAGSADEYAHDHGFDLIPTILDGEYVKLPRDGPIRGNRGCTKRTIELVLKRVAPASGIQRTTTACVRRPQRSTARLYRTTLIR